MVMSRPPTSTDTRESLLPWLPKCSRNVGKCLLSADMRAARMRTRMMPVSGRPSPTSMMNFWLAGITTTFGETARTSGRLFEGFHEYFAP